VRSERKTAGLVIGVGNLYRGDDGVGLVIARKLQARPPRDTIIREESGEGASLIEAWRGASTVIIVDTVKSGGRTGMIHRLDARRERVPSHFFHYSTHAFGVAEAVELARTLKQLPPQLIVYGIEGKQFRPGAGLSTEVKTAAEKVVLRIRKELDAIRKEA
jgi:hydrogenase maturation protease